MAAIRKAKDMDIAKAELDEQMKRDEGEALQRLVLKFEKYGLQW
jgi:hypothetical protein